MFTWKTEWKFSPKKKASTRKHGHLRNDEYFTESVSHRLTNETWFAFRFATKQNAWCKYCGCEHIHETNTNVCLCGIDHLILVGSNRKGFGSALHAIAHWAKYGHGETNSTCHMSNGQLSVFSLIARILYHAISHTPFTPIALSSP